MQAVDFRRAQNYLENNFIRYDIHNGMKGSENGWWVTNSSKTIIRIGNEDLSIYDSILPCNDKELHHHEGKYIFIHRFLSGYHEGTNAHKIGIYHNSSKREIHEELLKKVLV